MMCCYYQTSIVAIDDDSKFLKDITNHLEITNCRTFSSPIQALDVYSKRIFVNRIKSRIMKTEPLLEGSSAYPDDHLVLFNMRGLHEEIYNADRFSDVSVFIIDYYMDEMNGVEVCKQLANHPGKKILLTGGTDKETIAIEAFNNGIIHRFINKSDPNFPVKLNTAIETLKESFFCDLSTPLLSQISGTTTNLSQNPLYINFIRNLRDQEDAVEYYMLDAIGSSLLINADGMPTWIIVKHEQDINNYENLAREQEAKTELIENLANRSIIPFFFSDEDYLQPVSEWDKYTYHAYPFPGIKNYYYSIYKGYRENLIDKKRIISYNLYLNKNATIHEASV